MSDQVSIICGSGSFYGSGHLRRMEILSGLLSGRNIKNQIYKFTSRAKLKEITKDLQPDSLIVFDGRDESVEFLSEFFHVLAVDNRCKERKNLSHIENMTFFDSLPHPGSLIEKTFENCLIDPELLERNSHLAENSISGNEILLYTGSFERIDSLISQIKNRFDFLKIHLISGVYTEDGSKNIVTYKYLSRKDYYDLLFRSQYFVSYFGMSLMEALFLNKKTAVFDPGSESEVHGVLAAYLAKKIQIPVLSEKKSPDKINFTLEEPRLKPDGKGFDRILDLIEQIQKK